MDDRSNSASFGNVMPAKPQKAMVKGWIVVGLSIVFGVLACSFTLLMIVLGGRETPDEVSDDGVTTQTRGMDMFANLTKTEAISYLKNHRDATGALPKDYVGDEITDSVILDGDTIVSDLKLVYSYDTLDELNQIAKKKYGGSLLDYNDVSEDSYEIKEYDYYAIVKPNRIKGATSCDHGYFEDCDSLLSFKREYVDYLKEEVASSSFSDVAYFNTRDPEIVDRLLRVWTFFTSVGFYGGHGNIYDYSFEEQDDQFVLTVYYVGVGLNLEKYQADENFDDVDNYAINLFLKKYTVDKSSGGLGVELFGDSPIQVVKSLPLTKNEAESLLEE